MNWNEEAYRQLVIDILTEGKEVDNRNGTSRMVPGAQIKLDVSGYKLPLITGRKMYPRGIIGEAITLMQAGKGPIHISEFEQNGCNYWKLWSDKQGFLRIDYPVREHFHRIINNIKKDPRSRRHIIDLWNEENIPKLSLPCCHTQYQFIVENNNIHMIWTQRSADVMIGVPADMVLATIYLRVIANETGYEAGTITMNFGDTHIYTEHLEGAKEYTRREHTHEPYMYIRDIPYIELKPSDFVVKDYYPEDPINFLLKE